MLQVFQFSGLFNDSKTFVDSPLTAPEAVVLYNFQALPPNPTTAQLAAFYAQWFSAPGSDLVPVVPADWLAAPPMLAAIADPTFASWASEVNALWKTLTFMTAPAVAQDPDQHTLMYLPEVFVVPGARFREAYYWDQYWIIKGLLAVNMTSTAQGVLENAFYQALTLGFVPNGGREYYTDRSQPPLLAQMVWDYYTLTGNATFLAFAWPALDTEYKWWMRHAAVTLPDGAVVNQYVAAVGMPRPEGYVEDVAAAANLYDPNARACLFSEIASGAASGWDFSSRWFADSMSPADSCVRSLAPLDLNAIMFANEQTLARIASVLLRPSTAYRYTTAAARRRAALDAWFWSEDAGMFVDLNVTSLSPQVKPTPYLSALTPLWAGAYNTTNGTRVARLLATLVDAKLFEFPGGLPASLIFSGQQWDMSNAWAPLQWIAVEALRATGIAEAETLAATLVSVWLSSTSAAYTRDGVMYEKYDARVFGQPGGFGEYAPQTGFGWTNGVTLDWLARFPTTQRLSSGAESLDALRQAADALHERLLELM